MSQNTAPPPRTATIPALDRTPTGKTPYTVAAARRAAGWRTALAAPVHRETPTLVVSACPWCPLSARLFAAHVAHTCTAGQGAPAETTERA